MYAEFSGQPKSAKSEGDKDWGKYTVQGALATPKMMDGQKVAMSYSKSDPDQVESLNMINRITIKKLPG